MLTVSPETDSQKGKVSEFQGFEGLKVLTLKLELET